MKKVIFVLCVVFVSLWCACSNGSSSDTPSWTPPALPIIEGIAEVVDRVDGLGCEFLIVKVDKEDFTVKFTKEFASEMNKSQVGEYVYFKASENETFEFERMNNVPVKDLQIATYYRIVK